MSVPFQDRIESVDNKHWVRKGYLVDKLFNRVEHVIVDVDANGNFDSKKHLVFYPHWGWSGLREYCELTLFPGKMVMRDWWDGWWTTNWKYNDWSWCYGQK